MDNMNYWEAKETWIYVKSDLEESTWQSMPNVFCTHCLDDMKNTISNLYN